MGTIAALIIAFTTLTYSPSTSTVISECDCQTEQSIINDDYSGSIINDDYSGS